MVGAAVVTEAEQRVRLWLARGQGVGVEGDSKAEDIEEGEGVGRSVKEGAESCEADMGFDVKQSEKETPRHSPPYSNKQPSGSASMVAPLRSLTPATSSARHRLMREINNEIMSL